VPSTACSPRGWTRPGTGTIALFRPFDGSRTAQTTDWTLQMTDSAQVLPGPTQQVTLSRRFDAPRDRVWDAWTQPEQFAAWFGTPPFRTPPARVSMDLRTGGEWTATQVSDEDGMELPFVGVYREVRRPERLVFTLDNPADRTDPNVEVATVTLADANGGTQMVFQQVGHLPEEQYGLMAIGYARFFDRLAEHLAQG
jgi:uncharacterized protein YndB with AHSA1/START domain